MSTPNLEVGAHVRIVGDGAFGGVVGTIRHAPDRYGRFGIVPDEPVLVPRRRGVGRAFNPIWIIPSDLEVVT